MHSGLSPLKRFAGALTGFHKRGAAEAGPADEPASATDPSVLDPTNQVLARVHDMVANLSMVPVTARNLTWLETLRLIRQGVPGSLVECGTWRGGCSFGMALVQRLALGKVERPVWMFDSFQGLPDATERDGQRALDYQRDVASPTYYDNCTANLDQVREDAHRLGLGPDECRITPGWFEDSLPIQLERLRTEHIALLRIDADWYDPVLFVLERLEPLVSPGGVIIIDDYYVWDGCTRAVHDYLSRRDLPWRIHHIPDFTSAYLIKPGP